MKSAPHALLGVDATTTTTTIGKGDMSFIVMRTSSSSSSLDKGTRTARPSKRTLENLVVTRRLDKVADLLAAYATWTDSAQELRSLMAARNGRGDDTTLLVYDHDSMTATDVMMTLSHLLVPDTLFDVRAAMLLACACVCHVAVHPVIRGIAGCALRARAGTWIDFEQKNNRTREFARLMTHPLLLSEPGYVLQHEKRALQDMKDLCDRHSWAFQTLAVRADSKHAQAN